MEGQAEDQNALDLADPPIWREKKVLRNQLPAISACKAQVPRLGSGLRAQTHGPC